MAAYLDSVKTIPWIDALPEEWPDRYGIIEGYLLGVVCESPNMPPEFPRHRLAMRLYCLAELDPPAARQLFAAIPSPYHWWSGGVWIEVKRPE